MKGQRIDSRASKHKDTKDSVNEACCISFVEKSVNKYQEFQEKKGSQLVLKATAGLKRVRVENKDKDISQFHNQTTGGLT